jgi:hypothetical protein
MHWLYFSNASPRHLEDAGFQYDATCGYNDAIGFRAGTLQAFQLAASTNLLELPLSIMDTALFYPGYLGLTAEQGVDRCSKLVTEARRFGGTLVINWHDRSLAPERQWGRCYQGLLTEIESADAWFAKGVEAVEWFRWRRSIRFTGDSLSNAITVAAPPVPEGLPPARLVVQRHTSVEDAAFQGEARSLTL